MISKADLIQTRTFLAKLLASNNERNFLRDVNASNNELLITENNAVHITQLDKTDIVADFIDGLLTEGYDTDFLLEESSLEISS